MVSSVLTDCCDPGKFRTGLYWYRFDGESTMLREDSSRLLLRRQWLPEMSDCCFK